MTTYVYCPIGNFMLYVVQETEITELVSLEGYGKYLPPH